MQPGNIRLVGRPKRLPDDHKRFNVGMHPILVARLYTEAGRRQLSISDVIRELLNERLDDLDISRSGDIEAS